jgi:hypothetical protein
LSFGFFQVDFFATNSIKSPRKEAGLFCGSFPRKGEVFACVGLIQNLKDLKGLGRAVPRSI